MRFACTHCPKTYAHSGNLKTHQKKSHSELPVKKQRTLDFVSTTLTTTPDIIATTESAPATAPITATAAATATATRLSDDQILKIFRDELQPLVAERAATKEQLSIVNSELAALRVEVAAFREQAAKFAKKNTKWCVVCFERENSHAFMPCRHKCVCKECARQVVEKYKKCPICRNDAVSAQKIFDMAE